MANSCQKHPVITLSYHALHKTQVYWYIQYFYDHLRYTIIFILYLNIHFSFFTDIIITFMPQTTAGPFRPFTL